VTDAPLVVIATAGDGLSETGVGKVCVGGGELARAANAVNKRDRRPDW